MVHLDSSFRTFVMCFLHELQRNTGVSQKEVSDFIGLDPSNLSRIHRGKYTPTLKVFVAVICGYIALSKTAANAFSILVSTDKASKTFKYEFRVDKDIYV